MKKITIAKEFNIDGRPVVYELEKLKDGLKIIECRVKKCSSKKLDILEVPSEIDGDRVCSIGKEAFRSVECNRLVFPDSKFRLNVSALAETTGIKEIHFMNGPQIVPMRCFQGSGAEKITFSKPESISFIDFAAFNQTFNLKEFEWPKGLCTIPGLCFSKSSIEKLTNTESVSAISSDAFAFSKIKEFNFPNVTEIGNYAFHHCESLKTVNLPDCCRSLKNSCFAQSGLTALTNTGGIMSIGREVLAGTKIKEFDWPKEVKVVPELFFAYSKIQIIHNIESIEKIEPSAFLGVEIDEISFPSLKMFNQYSFAYSSIKKIVFPPKCKSVPSMSFIGDKELKELYFSADSITLDLAAFTDIGHPIDVYALNCDNLRVRSFSKNNSYLEKKPKENILQITSRNNGELIYDVTLHISFDTNVIM